MDRRTHLKLGIVPVKRGPGFTSTEDALKSKRNAFAALAGMDGNVEIVNLDSILETGIATMPDEIPLIERFLKDSGVDAVLMLHCDFGLEEIIARVGKAVGKPLLLWGARDDAPDPLNGIRIRDTQCGIFASSKVLQNYGIPFSYIENCHASDDPFIIGVEKFCRVSSVVKAFNSMRILVIGDRPSGFLSVMANEEELLSRFGIEKVLVSTGDFYKQVMESVRRSEPALHQELDRLKGKMDCSGLAEEKLEILAAMILFIKNKMERYHCSGAAMECWSSTLALFDMLPCQVIGELTDIGLPVACEADFAGAVTSVMLQAAALNEKPTFFADLTIRHPENDNAELLWHCGPFPVSLGEQGCRPCMDSSGRGQWKLKNGDITVARFGGANGTYSMFIGEGKSIDGPRTVGTYAWMEVNNWLEWERKLVEGPYIHHVSGMYGRYADVLQEACKYIPGLSADRML